MAKEIKTQNGSITVDKELLYEIKNICLQDRIAVKEATERVLLAWVKRRKKSSNPPLQVG